jgi:flagellar hook-length control protein FliK
MPLNIQPEETITAVVERRAAAVDRAAEAEQSRDLEAQRSDDERGDDSSFDDYLQPLLMQPVLLTPTDAANPPPGGEAAAEELAGNAPAIVDDATLNQVTRLSAIGQPVPETAASTLQAGQQSAAEQADLNVNTRVLNQEAKATPEAQSAGPLAVAPNQLLATLNGELTQADGVPSDLDVATFDQVSILDSSSDAMPTVQLRYSDDRTFGTAAGTGQRTQLIDSLVLADEQGIVPVDPVDGLGEGQAEPDLLNSLDRPVTQTGPRGLATPTAASHMDMQSLSLDSAASRNRTPLTTQLTRSILEFTRVESPEGESTLRLRLDPPELGELVISMDRSSDKLAVRVEAIEPSTLDMLLARGAEIEEQLRRGSEFSDLDFNASLLADSSADSESHRRKWDELLDGTSSIGQRPAHVPNRPSITSGGLSFRA